ncbi:MAG: protein phosphatase CheZ [Candidatus Magnetoovum sp. WYHC-5]|nr:protein phosphatase CheZ [Candidatus Magnetoovum sp. WYHC-5]
MGQYIGFNLGREEYVVPILMVQEIMKPAQTTKLPNLSPYIKGIINLRGKTIALLDLKDRLGLIYDSPDTDGKVIVLNMGKITFGICVDGITGVMNIDNSIVKTNIALVDDDADKCIKGIVNLTDTRMVMILDMTKLLSVDDMSLLVDDITNTEEMADGTVIVTKRVQTMGGELFVREIKDKFIKASKERGVEQDQINAIMEEVQKLLDCFSSGDIAGAEEAIAKLSSYGEKEIFSEVGKMTRKLHDSLNDFKNLIDPRLKDLAEGDVPDAADKLLWVISKTEEAASKSITIAEKNQSEISQMNLSLDIIEEMLAKNGADAGAGKDAIELIRSGLAGIDNDFMDLMLAQEYQDLTGQIIKKVLKMVAQVEADLITLVKVFGVKVETPKKSLDEKIENIEQGILPGPQIKAGDNVLAGQGDIDDLLAEFGF